MQPSSTANYIEPTSVRAWRPTPVSELRIEIAGDRTILFGKVRRLFPNSRPDAYYSLHDPTGTEVGIVRSLDGMDAESRKAIEEELERRYFTPLIESILSLRQDGGMWLFRAQTQRGQAVFYVRNWRDSSHEIKPGRWLIVSVDGQRYEIADWESLDARSKDLLEQLF